MNTFGANKERDEVGVGEGEKSRRERKETGRERDEERREMGPRLGPSLSLPHFDLYICLTLATKLK